MSISKSWVYRAGAGLLCVIGCGTAGEPTGDFVIVEETITITPPSVTIAVRDSTRLTASASGHFATSGVSWRSVDTLVASVASTGMVRGVSAGTTTIIATSRADSVGVAAAVVTVR
jgi:uncharacterized protein YjdB